MPEVDAPNVAGARALGLAWATRADSGPRALRAAVEAGAVKALFVLDPGPAGSAGDTSWLVGARRAGTLATLIVQATGRQRADRGR